jgi:hypothetical protein
VSRRWERVNAALCDRERDALHHRPGKTRVYRKTPMKYGFLRYRILIEFRGNICVVRDVRAVLAENRCNRWRIFSVEKILRQLLLRASRSPIPSAKRANRYQTIRFVGVGDDRNRVHAATFDAKFPLAHP